MSALYGVAIIWGSAFFAGLGIGLGLRSGARAGGSTVSKPGR